MSMVAFILATSSLQLNAQQIMGESILILELMPLIFV